MADLLVVVRRGPDDLTYCDNGREIHKHGGYWDASTNQCVYAFDETGQSCGESCTEQPRDYTQCGGECNGQRYNSSNTIEVKKRVSDSCQVSYQCRDLGKKPGECGNSSCQVINTYDECGGSNDCTPKDKMLYEVKEYNGESCGTHGRFRCREKGYVTGKCDVPKCDEDKTYCDDGKEIHKHDGYYDPGSGDADGDGCVYAFDETGESC